MSGPSIESRGDIRRSMRRNLLAGVCLVASLGIGVGGWAATSNIAGAIIAAGTLVVDGNVKKVQHPTGGVVGTVLARDGDRVSAGDVLLRLDDTLTRANLGIVMNGIIEHSARRARLEAERDGAAEVAFPQLVREQSVSGRGDAILAGEVKLFEMRRAARAGQKSQLQQRIQQYGDESQGHLAQEQAKRREISLIERELMGARELFAKNLIPISKMTMLEREATRLEGERGQLLSAIAQAKGKIAEAELQIVQIDKDLSSEVGRELREVEARLGELEERRIAAQDQLRRVELRAPLSGVVHQSSVHTVGGVIAPGDVVMLIVPEGDRLMVEARVAPHEIDQLSIGQMATLRFSAFNQRTTPQVGGTVSRIAADLTVDQRSGLSYFAVRVAISDGELTRLGDVKPVPGMPVEVFMQTHERTVLSYLLKPLSDQLHRSLRGR